jgi:hypothetical protein
VGDGYVFKVRRDGERLFAQLTGQGEAEIYAEAQNRFFYKMVDAQLDFVTDGSAPATAVVLHQNGLSPTWQRIDEAGAASIEAALAARVQSQAPQPGSEAALRKLVAGTHAGSPPYELMTEELAKVTRQQLPALQSGIAALGAVQSVEFRGVSASGWDMYEVRQEKGLVQWRIHLAADGRIDGAYLTPGP